MTGHQGRVAAAAPVEKLDVAMLQYQNQKLVQQLEAQKVEYSTLENKFHQLKEKQKSSDDTLVVIGKFWERLVSDLESQSVCTNGIANGGYDLERSHMLEDGASCPAEDDFLNRLLDTGATESCSNNIPPSQTEDELRITQTTTKNILQNVIFSIECLPHVYENIASALGVNLPEGESSRKLQETANDLQMEIRNLQVAVRELHLKHRLLAAKVQYHRDTAAKNKAEHKRLAEELASTVAELEESNCKLATLKAERDLSRGAPFLFPTLGKRQVGVDKVRDKQKELQDLESTLKELKNLISSRLVKIRGLHERRIEILKKLANMQNALLDAKGITSSKAYLLLSNQLAKSKEEMDQCRMSLEKLQVEKDKFVWHDKEVTMKVDLADASVRVSIFLESQISELEQELQKLVDEKSLFKTKLGEDSREPGRKEIIAEFKALVSSLPKDMGVMQSELNKYKEAASEIHSLRAEVQSLSNTLERKVNEFESISGRSANQLSEIKKLQEMVRDLRESEQELKLFLDMHRRESTDSREVMECRDMEYKAWAHVQSLKSSLDEHNLELRVKGANEAEAVSQQRLAIAEAEIADLRQNIELSGRERCKLSEALKSKHEEGEAYLSEIESIGQAYEDMQTQNRHLLQQITERDDYNIKLVMEGVKARQLQEALLSEIRNMDKKLVHANSFMDFLDMKVARFDDQLKIMSEQVGKLSEDGRQSSVSLEDAQRRLTDVQRDTQLLRLSLDETQSNAAKSRSDLAELLIELEVERFKKKRIEEELEVVTRKATSLREQAEGSTVLGKLKQEIREYRGILKCRICHDRQKEVVIAKCYHLFCNQCVRKTLESRHRKCPTCASSFGPNDVKPIYI